MSILPVLISLLTLILVCIGFYFMWSHIKQLERKWSPTQASHDHPSMLHHPIIDEKNNQIQYEMFTDPSSIGGNHGTWIVMTSEEEVPSPSLSDTCNIEEIFTENPSVTTTTKEEEDQEEEDTIIVEVNQEDDVDHGDEDNVEEEEEQEQGDDQSIEKTINDDDVDEDDPRNNSSIVCLICDGRYIRGGKNRHEKTKKHLNRLS